MNHTPDTGAFTRGNLPHWYKPGYAHFVTYRLANTIPLSRLQQWRADRDRLLKAGPPEGMSSAEHRAILHKQFFSRYDEYLDRHREVDWLARPAVAKAIRENLYHHHGTKYELLAWCIMPNHVHVLLQPFEIDVAEAASFRPVAIGTDAGSVGHGSVGRVFADEVPDSRSPLSRIMHSLKSYTANRVNEILKRSGGFWQRESYDHWVRDLEELQRILDYIRFNPVRAGLCDDCCEFRYSSAFDRFQLDGSTCGLVGRLRDDWKKS